MRQIESIEKERERERQIERDDADREHGERA